MNMMFIKEQNIVYLWH